MQVKTRLLPFLMKLVMVQLLLYCNQRKSSKTVAKFFDTKIAVPVLEITSTEHFVKLKNVKCLLKANPSLLM